MTPQERVRAALDMAIRYASTDGARHKAWVIDQMVRALTDCPKVEKHGTDESGKPWTFHSYGESEEYRGVVAFAKAGEDGPETYEWDVGVAP